MNKIRCQILYEDQVVYDSKTYLNERIIDYDDEAVVYSYSEVTQGGVTYTKVDADELSNMSEEEYLRLLYKYQEYVERNL